VEFAGKLAAAARVFATQPTLRDTMAQVGRLAVDIVPGVDAAGLSLSERRAGNPAPRSSVVTDPFAGACESLQLRLGEGPALERDLDGDVVVVDDLAEHSRWPALTARLFRLGVRALVTCRLTGERMAPARLNLYARHPLPPQARQAAELYVVHAAIAMNHAYEVENLVAAMTTRERIGQAVGMLMNRHRLESERVFEVLVRVSQELNVKLRDLAEIVLDTPVDTGEVADLARRAAKDAGARVDELRYRRTMPVLGPGVRPAAENRADAERRARLAAARAVHRLCMSQVLDQGGPA
jgi:hypothetical protein